MLPSLTGTYNECPSTTECIFTCPAGRERAGPKYLLGDANGDGVIDMDDVNLIVLYVAGHLGLGEIHLLNADVDGNGEIDFYDATLISRYVAGRT